MQLLSVFKYLMVPEIQFNQSLSGSISYKLTLQLLQRLFVSLHGVDASTSASPSVRKGRTVYYEFIGYMLNAP